MALEIRTGAIGIEAVTDAGDTPDLRTGAIGIEVVTNAGNQRSLRTGAISVEVVRSLRAFIDLEARTVPYTP
jgi:hypothetical protein